VPGGERVQFVTSGTEATLAAIRFARAATGRHRVAKLEGGWHGWHDFALWSFGELDGPTSRPSPVPVSAGLPPEVGDATVVLPYNDPAAITLVEDQADDLACVIVEGVIGGGGVIPADRAWLHELREVCARRGVVFVLDEVITGFSLGPGGAAAAYGITPDLVTLGKVIGGGNPIGAVAGRRDILDLALARPGGPRPVMLFGTWTGSPLAMVAGRATLDVLLRDGGWTFGLLDELGERMRSGLDQAFRAHGVTCSVTGTGRMFAVHLGCAEPPTSPRQRSHDQVLATEVLSATLLGEGVFFNGGMHLGFVSTAHTAEDVDHVVAATERSVGQLLEEGVLVP
jgi:glutamate-1-semialdehyde 2,1-aminomutase